MHRITRTALARPRPGRRPRRRLGRPPRGRPLVRPDHRLRRRPHRHRRQARQRPVRHGPQGPAHVLQLARPVRGLVVRAQALRLDVSDRTRLGAPAPGELQPRQAADRRLLHRRLTPRCWAGRGSARQRPVDAARPIAAPRANIRSHMTSDGSPYPRLKRAIAAGNLAIIEATAAELGWVALRDALGILLVIEAKDDERFEPRRSAGRAGWRSRSPDLALAELAACWSRWTRCRTSTRSARSWRWPSAPASRGRRRRAHRRRRRGASQRRRGRFP